MTGADCVPSREPKSGQLGLCPKAPHALLITGIISRSEALAGQAESLLADAFGPIAERSPVIPFNFTDYYEPEMGKDLVRCWLGFSRLVPADRLAEIKLLTDCLEQQLSLSPPPNRKSEIENRKSVGRQANLDPGLLTLHNLVLATTKDYAHRIYLHSGIHAEVTLVFNNGRYEPLPWTYADYQTETCHKFLLRCRERLKY